MRNIRGSTATSATHQADCKPLSALRWDMNGEGRLTKGRQKPERSWSPGCSEGQRTAQSHPLGWEWSQLQAARGSSIQACRAQGPASGEGGGGPRKKWTGQGPGQRNTRLCGGRAGTEALGRDKGAFSSTAGNRGFSSEGAMSSERSPAVRKRMSLELGTRAGARTRGLRPTPGPLSEQPPSPFL